MLSNKNSSEMGSILFELFNKIFIPLGSRNVVVFRQYVIQAIEIKHFNPIRLEENEQTFWIKKKMKHSV